MTIYVVVARSSDLGWGMGNIHIGHAEMWGSYLRTQAMLLQLYICAIKRCLECFIPTICFAGFKFECPGFNAADSNARRDFNVALQTLCEG